RAVRRRNRLRHAQRWVGGSGRRRLGSGPRNRCRGRGVLRCGRGVFGGRRLAKAELFLEETEHALIVGWGFLQSGLSPQSSCRALRVFALMTSPRTPRSSARPRSTQAVANRSEERRVGKEYRPR